MNDVLKTYAALVLEKKEQLNLTGAATEQEILDRHIADGLELAKLIKTLTPRADFTLADIGAGAGFIGIACAAQFPQAKVTLVEGMEKRCKFLNWAVMKLGLKNVKVLCERAGEKKYPEHQKFDFVTERAMGKIADVLPLCLGYKKENGFFIAFQSEVTTAGRQVYTYKLKDAKARNLVVF